MRCSIKKTFYDPQVKIGFLNHYEQNGRHLILNGHELPCEISLGRNAYYYVDSNGEDSQTSKSLWVVDFENRCYIPLKEFLKLEDAYKYALSCYIHYLDVESKKLHDRLIHLNTPLE